MTTLRATLAALLLLATIPAWADLTLTGGTPAGQWAPGQAAYAWTAYSDHWHGPRIAYCAQPGTPARTGRHAYWHAGPGVSAEDARILALADELPRREGQFIVHAVLREEPLPAWVRRADEPVRTWHFRHPVLQDMLVIDRIPPIEDPRVRYLSGNSLPLAAAWPAGFGNPTPHFGQPSPGTPTPFSGLTPFAHPVPAPATWTLIAAGLLALFSLHRRRV